MGQCFTCVEEKKKNEELVSPLNKGKSEEEGSEMGGLVLEDTELDDAQTFYEQLERNRSRTNSESSKSGVLSLLSLQAEAKEVMGRAISMYWTIKEHPEVPKESVDTAAARVKSLISELSTYGITFEKEQHPFDKSLTMVQNWRLGKTPSTVSIDDSPVGRHTKESFNNAITTLPDTITKIHYLIKIFVNTYEFLR
eukprot:TRINITY_DN17604_c0_g3_i1.p1 TRINITY_DN17604_c0_g3~~TRINITY_DN17604_c0_g3_i1.p1  ORF type:complete len:196 (+),score=59.15 TRINITY_DN17604_c0_g3_i1:68-655(+)